MDRVVRAGSGPLPRYGSSNLLRGGGKGRSEGAAAPHGPKMRELPAASGKLSVLPCLAPLEGARPAVCKSHGRPGLQRKGTPRPACAREAQMIVAV